MTFTMATVELDSFVEKFKHLSFSGITATLNLETNKGNTSVCLKAEIGSLTPSCGFGINARTPGYYPRRLYKNRNNQKSFEHKEAEEASSTAEKMCSKVVKSKDEKQDEIDCSVDS